VNVRSRNRPPPGIFDLCGALAYTDFLRACVALVGPVVHSESERLPCYPICQGFQIPFRKLPNNSCGVNPSLLSSFGVARTALSDVILFTEYSCLAP
jgi:hypothetical protein